MIYSSFKS